MLSLKKRREEKLKEKELLNKIKEEEKEIEKDLPPEEKYTITQMFEMLTNKSEEDIEYESYLTEEEKQEEQESKKQEKRIIITAGSILLAVIIILIVGVNIFYNTFKPDILKVTQHLLESYYEEKYGEKVKINSIEELTYQNDEKEIIKTGIYLATTKDNKHLMCVNNELIGDDISIGSINSELLEYITINTPSTNLITHEVDLSYQDYYINFNRNLGYINTLPSNTSLNELIISDKLTITYKLIYQGDINIEEYQNLLNSFSSDSKFYLIRHEVGLPTNLKIVTKEEILDLNVTSEIQKEENITNIELSRDFNSVTSVELTSISKSGLESLDNYELTNGLLIEYEKERQYNKDEVEKTSYYMLRVSNSHWNQHSTIQLSKSKYGNKYRELKKEEYNDIIFIEVGGYTYIISEEEALIATKTAKKGFLCNLGIC